MKLHTNQHGFRRIISIFVSRINFITTTAEAHISYFCSNLFKIVKKMTFLFSFFFVSCQLVFKRVLGKILYL